MTGKAGRGSLADRRAAIEVAARTTLHAGFRQVDSLSFRRLPDEGDPAAGDLRTVTREVVLTRPVVAILPLDRRSGDVVLIRQFRIGAQLGHGRGMLVEIPAGAVEDGESAAAAAARELAEETGLAARRLAPIQRFLTSPGLSNEAVTLFLAEVDAAGLGERAGEDGDEITYPFTAAREEAIAAADRGAISNVFTILALNWLARHKDRTGDVLDAAGAADQDNREDRQA